MKLSELRPYVIEAHMCGLKKIPGQRMWVRTWHFDKTHYARFYITNLDIIYTRFPVDWVVHRAYDNYWKQYLQMIKEKKIK